MYILLYICIGPMNIIVMDVHVLKVLSCTSTWEHPVYIHEKVTRLRYFVVHTYNVCTYHLMYLCSQICLHRCKSDHTVRESACMHSPTVHKNLTISARACVHTCVHSCGTLNLRYVNTPLKDHCDTFITGLLGSFTLNPRHDI